MNSQSLVPQETYEKQCEEFLYNVDIIQGLNGLNETSKGPLIDFQTAFIYRDLFQRKSGHTAAITNSSLKLIVYYYYNNY